MGWSNFFGKKWGSGSGTDSPKLIRPVSAGGLLSIDDDFAKACLMRELTAIAEDVLQPYIFKDVQFDNVYDYAIRGLCQKTDTIKDILIQAMMGQDIIVNQVSITQEGFNRVSLFMGESGPLENELKQLLPHYEIKVLKSVYFA